MIIKSHNSIFNEMDLIRIIGILFPPRNFYHLKTRLFSILAFGVLIDFGISLVIKFNEHYRLNYFQIEFITPGIGTAIVASIVLLILVIINYILLMRKNKLIKALYDLLENPSISDNIKVMILDEIKNIRKRE